MPGLGANVLFSVGASKEKGVKFDLLHAQPTLRCGRHAFPISADIPRMLKLDVIPDDQVIRPREGRRIQGLAPEEHTKEHWSLKTVHFGEEEETGDDDSLFDSIEYSFVTGHLEIPDELIDWPNSIKNCREAIPGPQSKGCIKSMREESKSLLDHSVFE